MLPAAPLSILHLSVHATHLFTRLRAVLSPLQALPASPTADRLQHQPVQGKIIQILRVDTLSPDSWLAGAVPGSGAAFTCSVLPLQHQLPSAGL